MGSQPLHRSEPLSMLPMLHQPTRRLGAEKDTNTEEERGDKGRAELQAPGDSTGVLDDDVGAEAEEDADDDPELPEHDEGAADAGGCHLGGVDRDGGVFGADADAHYEAHSEKLLPGVGEAGGDGGCGETACRDEDFTATTEVMVQRINDESATALVSIAPTQLKRREL